jgi:DNA-binding response OmpR family regulator
MKRKILVVDDEQDIAKALKVRLKTNGYDVILARDSIQACTLAREEIPSLIILDVFIPGGGGFIVCEKLKNSSTTRHIPIIFLTGIPGGEEKAYQAGACSYLMKPYNPSVLLEEIRKALETKGKQALEAARTNVGVSSLPS